MDKTLPVAVDQYVHFHEKGFLIVRAVITPDKVQELLDHVDALLSGQVEARRRQHDAGSPLEHLLRIHIIHRPL